MLLSAIVAMSENRVIGKDNNLPWRLPADLRHFKQITLGKPILMGRKTYESIGKPLPGRSNIIITRDNQFKAEGCQVFNSLETALASVSELDEAIIIGGAMLFQQTLDRVQRIYLTIIHQEFVGDTFFPELDLGEWEERDRVDFLPDDENPYSYSFLVLGRK